MPDRPDIPCTINDATAAGNIEKADSPPSERSSLNFGTALAGECRPGYLAPRRVPKSHRYRIVAFDKAGRGGSGPSIHLSRVADR